MKQIYIYKRKGSKSFLENCGIKFKKKDASYYREFLHNDLIQEAIDCLKDKKERDK